MVQRCLSHSAKFLVPQIHSIPKDIFEGQRLVAEASFCQPRVHVRAKSVGSNDDGQSFRKSGNGIERFLPDLNQGVSRLGTLGIFLTLAMVLTPSRVRAQQPLSERFFHRGTIEGEVLRWRVPDKGDSAHVGPRSTCAGGGRCWGELRAGFGGPSFWCVLSRFRGLSVSSCFAVSCLT